MRVNCVAKCELACWASREGAVKYILFRRVRASLSQKLIVPSAPAVENVPCTGWKFMSFTAKTRVWSFAVGA